MSASKSANYIAHIARRVPAELWQVPALAALGYAGSVAYKTAHWPLLVLALVGFVGIMAGQAAGWEQRAAQGRGEPILAAAAAARAAEADPERERARWIRNNLVALGWSISFAGGTLLGMLAAGLGLPPVFYAPLILLFSGGFFAYLHHGRRH